jgi:parallel beta-helix repeat protein
MMNYMFVFLLVISKNVLAQDEALIGEHTNATYFVKQYRDIQGSLYSALENGYNTIRIAKGTYFMPRSLLINNDDTIILGTTDTILQLNNTKILGLAMFVLMGVSNVSITNITLDGYNNASQVSYELNGIAVVNVTSGILENVKLNGFRNGIYINASTDVNILNINISLSQYDGFLVRNSTNIMLSNSSSCCNGRHGMNFFGNMTNVTISSNVAFSHKTDSACAIRVADADNVFLEGNVLSNNEIGLCLRNLDGVQVMKNLINRTTDAKCIYINSITGSKFVSNECDAKIINPLVSSHLPPPPPKTSASPPPPPKKKHKSASCMSNVLSYALVVLSGMLSMSSML